MRSHLVREDVYRFVEGAGWKAVLEAVLWAVLRGVNKAVDEAVSSAASTAADRAVWAGVDGDPDHPALEDLLREAL